MLGTIIIAVVGYGYSFLYLCATAGALHNAFSTTPTPRHAEAAIKSAGIAFVSALVTRSLTGW